MSDSFKILKWINQSRADVKWISGPDAHGNYSWDIELENQNEIVDLVQSYDSEWVPPDEVPVSVTARQIRLALLGLDLLSSVENLFDQIEEPLKSQARIWWEFSNEVYRGNHLIAQLAPQLQLTDEQLDQIFIEAAKL